MLLRRGVGVGELLQAGHEVEVRVWRGWHLVVLGVEAGKNARWQLIHPLEANPRFSHKNTRLLQGDSL